MTAADSERLALAIADRLLDADAIQASLPAPSCGSLTGLAGTALLHARLATLDDRFALAAVDHWNRAAACARGTGGSASGVFSGPGAVAASLILGAPYLPDPRQVHRQYAGAACWLSYHATTIADLQRDTIAAGLPPTSWAAYDAICGLAGIGRILMAALGQGHGQARTGLDAALHTLTAMANNRTGRRPGWWLPADAHPATAHAHHSGAATTGTAHGIAGPLALLATAYSAGHHVPGQVAAIRTTADWLLRWQDPATDTWAPQITGDELDHDLARPGPGRRDAWCYGTPGISAALTQAANALEDDTYRDTAYHAMRSLAARSPQSWDVEGPTICHGYAGILQSAHNHPDLAEQAAAEIERAVNPHHRYLVQHMDRGTAGDSPGLLTGAAGVALALADYAELAVPGPAAAWDCILLLS
jgi:hypothetical protein